MLGDETRLDTCAEVCGDGVNLGGVGWLAGAGVCDDGNNYGGDGCSAGCRVETYYDAGNEPRNLCSSGNWMAPDHCHEWCGDGRRDDDPDTFNPRRNLFKLMEWSCDDGNLRQGDGCDDNC